MERILKAGSAGVHFEVLSNPEFLAEGTALRDLEVPDRVLIGGHDTKDGRRATTELANLYAHWVPRDRILTTNLWSSELSKLAANAFLAQRISSINSLAAVCELTDADVSEVARAVGMDTRIGPKFLNAGVGFGGSCFTKDVLNLVYLCEQQGLSEVAAYWEQVVRMNSRQADRFVERMLRAMFESVANKRIAVFGFAFKPDTSDTRESPSIRVVRSLVEEHAAVVVTDPRALDSARRDLADLGPKVTFEPDPLLAATGAHAIALMTEWADYEILDYRQIYAAMAKPAFVFDGRNRLDHRKLFEIGFEVYAIGKRPLSHL